MQDAVRARLVRATVQRERVIRALDGVVVYNHERAVGAEKELESHRMAFEETVGAEELDAGNVLSGVAVESESDFDAFVDRMDRIEPAWSFEDIPRTAPSAREVTQGLVATMASAESESNGDGAGAEDLSDFFSVAETGSAEEEDLGAFSDRADDVSVGGEDDDADTLILTKSEDASAEDFESVVLSDEESDVDFILGTDDAWVGSAESLTTSPPRRTSLVCIADCVVCRGVSGFALVLGSMA